MLTIKQKLHKFLFPSQHEEARGDRLLIEKLNTAILDKTDLVSELRKTIQELEKKPSPTMADLMRDSLSLEPLEFSNVQQEGVDAGLPPHFLKSADPVLRKTYVTQLSQIFQLEVWHAMIKYHLNYQGNYSIRKAATDMEVFAGRMSINGIALLRNDVRKGHEEYLDGSKPTGDYSESDDRRFETTEGVHFKNDNEEEK